MLLVTPPPAMLRLPLPVIGPPVNPEPLPTLVTVPAPVPASFTVSWIGAVEVKVAVTVVAAFNEMVQVVLVLRRMPPAKAREERSPIRTDADG